MTDLDLPAAVLDMVEFTPIEDLVLAILRDAFPSVPVVSLIADDPPDTFIIARRVSGFSEWTGDERFLDKARFFVHCFTSDPDGDEKGALLAEAVRVAMRDAWLKHKRYPGFGAISRIRLMAEPHRETDWATSTGPVQYADLPTGMWRYAAQYEITVRKSR